MLILLLVHNWIFNTRVSASLASDSDTFMLMQYSSKAVVSSTSPFMSNLFENFSSSDISCLLIRVMDCSLLSWIKFIYGRFYPAQKRH